MTGEDEPIGGDAQPTPPARSATPLGETTSPVETGPSAHLVPEDHDDTAASAPPVRPGAGADAGNSVLLARVAELEAALGGWCETVAGRDIRLATVAVWAVCFVGVCGGGRAGTVAGAVLRVVVWGVVGRTVSPIALVGFRRG
jgi:hypothetical protein